MRDKTKSRKNEIGGFQHHFSDRVLSIDRDTAQIWGELTEKTAKSGRTLHVPDGLIAATAVQHGLHLITRNQKDFEGTGVLLMSPWDA